ncbi:MAG: type II secretion system F family protein [Neisseriaceae bacterium]|nr:type II secretion system F family protein [Neisseriaceae bacterium]
MAKDNVPSMIAFSWKGKDRGGKTLEGKITAQSKEQATLTLRKQGVLVSKISRSNASLVAKGKKITEKQVVIFTRQLATMMKAGIPMVQAFEICARGNENPAMAALISKIKSDVEGGVSLTDAFAAHPAHFDDLFCSLIRAGEMGGVLELLLNRLATYKEKIMAIKGKIKSALFYPTFVLGAALLITFGIMIFVIPTFSELFRSFGKPLPWITQVIVDISDVLIAYGVYVVGFMCLVGYAIVNMVKNSVPLQRKLDLFVLKIPVLGVVIQKSSVARWARTLSTMFTAGIPLVEALEAVAKASGNYAFEKASNEIQKNVSMGISLTIAMQQTKVFDNMMLQMVAIGEESGALDSMLDKAAEFYEEEVDNLVASMSSLMEPVIMVVVGVLVGTIVIAMYLPIFQLGDVVSS